MNFMLLFISELILTAISADKIFSNEELRYYILWH